MNEDKNSTIARRARRLMSFLVAVPVAVAAGFVAVVFLDGILPRSKPWGLWSVILCAFAAAISAGVACMRAIGTAPPTPASEQPQQPFDSD
jgi:protein-S-isoprenylcysteine O-methyltransferase Ste14